ncbi:MAG: zinc ribbon domain-containing protein [Limisphaerales bacterium]
MHTTHEAVRRLLDLHALEEQAAELKRDTEPTTRVDALIESRRGNIPISMLILHDRLRAKGRRSVATMRHGVCGGCHLALGVGNVAEVERGELRRCGNCGRYLFPEEIQQTAPPSPPPEPDPVRQSRSRSATTGARTTKVG